MEFDFDDQIELEHILFFDRKCRVCGQVKNLMNDFYRTRKDRTNKSAYSYECKECTKERIINTRKKEKSRLWEYPDW
jgi:uncharacterized protein YlaI